MTAPDDLNALAGRWKSLAELAEANERAALAERKLRSHSNKAENIIAELHEESAKALRELASIKAGDSVVVPRVPTDEMLVAGWTSANSEHSVNISGFITDTACMNIFIAMLAAAPKGPK